jgi:hypothetical protein
MCCRCAVRWIKRLSELDLPECRQIARLPASYFVLTALAGSLRCFPNPFQALQTPKIYSPGYIYKPNVYAEIWGVLLKTGGSMQNESVFPRVWAHWNLLLYFHDLIILPFCTLKQVRLTMQIKTDAP